MQAAADLECQFREVPFDLCDRVSGPDHLSHLGPLAFGVGGEGDAENVLEAGTLVALRADPNRAHTLGSLAENWFREQWGRRGPGSRS